MLHLCATPLQNTLPTDASVVVMHITPGHSRCCTVEQPQQLTSLRNFRLARWVQHQSSRHHHPVTTAAHGRTSTRRKQHPLAATSDASSSWPSWQQQQPSQPPDDGQTDAGEGDTPAQDGGDEVAGFDTSLTDNDPPSVPWEWPTIVLVRHSVYKRLV